MALVIQRMDNAIYLINHRPIDTFDSFVHPLNYLALMKSQGCK